jgi:hypothetical protein
VSLHRPSFRQALALLVSAAALAAIAIVWTRVVSTISSGSPPASTVQATSIIWRDRVFVSVPELSRWLRSRGATYEDWSRNHPAARDRLEHLMRPPPPPSTTVEVSPAPVAAGPSASSTSSAGFPFESVVVTLLILLAVACAAAASLPEALLYRFPRLTRTVAPRRDLFLAGAAAILIAVLAAVVLS